MTQSCAGKIWLVGAGPGDYGLLTLRGYEVLKRADTVIYDRLTGEGILSLIPENAERIDAGKSSGSHTMTQREIEDAIISCAREGKNVVRLKGGDPYIFGRGGEEAEAIMRAGLEFEVVPGVSSALSVPAYAGIPATHRDYCSGVSIFTAHDKNNLLPDFTRTTSIFLMGVSHAKELQEKLLDTMPADTPCAIIQDGTTSSQRTIRTILSGLHDAVQDNHITPPAIIVVGMTAGLNLDYRNKLPLNGKRIIITRPEERGKELSRILRDKGAEVILLPTISTHIIPNALDGVNISGWDWIGFTSVTGVEALFELLSKSGRDIREIGGAKIAAIGSATMEALRSHGLKVDYVPKVYDGRHLAEGLCELGGKILMLRAENGTPDIEEVFIKYGIANRQVCIYGTRYVKLTRVPQYADIIIFTSSSTVRGFAASTGTLREAEAVCIGRQTADEAVRAGFTRIKIAEQADITSLVKACT